MIVHMNAIVIIKRTPAPEDMVYLLAAQWRSNQQIWS